MSFFKTSSSSSVSTGSDLKSKIQDVKTRLLIAKKELDDLRISKMSESLVKIDNFLDLCKKSQGKKDPINELITLLTQLLDDVLEPLQKEKKSSVVEITEDLTDQFWNLFNELDGAIDTKPPPRNRTTRGVDVSEDVDLINRKLKAALQIFLSTGPIKCTSRSDRGKSIKMLDVTRHASEQPVGQPSELYQAPTSFDSGDSPGGDSDENAPRPAVHGVMQRFRILLLGKSGVGKSSLIENIFKVPEMDVAHHRAGDADINKGLTSSDNPHFILHDSIGYESGTLEHFDIVENFIKKRSKEKEISEQIHAIWLCAKVPVAGGRIFETGDEKLFEMNLGRVPLMMVFTQYDELVSRAEIELLGAPGLDEEQLYHKARANAEKVSEALCTRPLREVCKKIKRSSLPPVTKVSIVPGYENTLSNLVQLTQKCVATVVDQVNPSQPTSRSTDPESNNGTVWITWAMAQRVDAETSVQASIEIGRKKFWSCLGSGFWFKKKRPLDQYLDVLHEDIVLVWNFYDPDGYLTSGDFKNRLRASIHDLTVVKQGNQATRLSRATTSAAAAAVLGATLIPGATIVGPIAALLAFALWASSVSERSLWVIQCLMAYVVNLTILMELLFLKIRQLGGIRPLSEQVLNEILEEFQDSARKRDIHEEIKSFVKTNEQDVLEKVVQVIEKYRADLKAESA